MALTNTRERYGRMAQAFHWTTAGLILALLPIGVIMTWLPAGTADEVARKVWLYSLHKTLGVTLLAVALARIIWAIFNVRPAPLHPERRTETFAAETVHWMLYAAILLAPLTGLAHHYASTGFAPIWWPFSQDIAFIPKDEALAETLAYAHWALAVLIVVSLVAHIGGALKHVFVDQDKTLARMVEGDDCLIILPKPEKSGAHAGPAIIALAAVFLAAGGAASYAWNEHSVQALAASSAAGIGIAETGGNESTAQGPVWAVDREESRLAITVRQLGSPVDGAFSQWRADIVFDPDNLAVSRVEAVIGIASLQLGTVSGQAIGPDFLDAETYPQARFVAETFRAMGDDLFEADGTLTIAGTEQTFTLPFTLAIDGDTAVMNATAVIDRRSFNVGMERYGSEDSVAFDVTVTIDITASRAETTVPAS